MSNEVLIGVIADLESELDHYKKALDVAMDCLESIESNTDTTITSRVYVKRAQKEINQILGKEEGEK